VSKRNAFSIVSVTCIAFSSFALLLCANSAKAQNRFSSYTFLMASGFLCDPGDSAACPASAKSANGDSYEMSGAGRLNTQGKAIQAAGTFTHKANNGYVLETGVWIASELVSFDSYGVAPGALSKLRLALAPKAFGPQRSPIPSGPMPTGGLAVFRIHLLPVLGTAKTAVLQVNCALGDVPRERSVEGIRLTLEKNGGEFSDEMGGRVMFLAMRPDVSAPAKTLLEETTTDSEKPPNR
jgi:hypothetical protein